MVGEVLSYSSVLELSPDGKDVRMYGWESWIMSSSPAVSSQGNQIPNGTAHEAVVEANGGEEKTDLESPVEDDEEDDVVFVMGST